MLYIKVPEIEKEIIKKIPKKYAKIFDILSTILICFFELLAFIYYPFYYALTCNLFILALYIFNIIIQNLFRRPRPYIFSNIIYNTPAEKSFPSSHTLISILMFICFNRIPFIYLILLVPIFRVLALQHWISDIILTILFYIPIFILFRIFSQLLL